MIEVGACFAHYVAKSNKLAYCKWQLNGKWNTSYLAARRSIVSCACDMCGIYTEPHRISHLVIAARSLVTYICARRKILTQRLLVSVLFAVVHRLKRSESVLGWEDDRRRSSGEKEGSSRASYHPWSQHIGHLSDLGPESSGKQASETVRLWIRTRRNQWTKEYVAREVSRW